MKKKAMNGSLLTFFKKKTIAAVLNIAIFNELTKKMTGLKIIEIYVCNI